MSKVKSFMIINKISGKKERIVWNTNNKLFEVFGNIKVSNDGKPEDEKVLKLPNKINLNGIIYCRNK